MEVYGISAASIILVLLGILVGGAAGALLVRKLMYARMESSRNAAQRIIEEAQKEAETLRKEAVIQAKDSLYQMKLDFEKEVKDTRKELHNFERRLLQKEENLEKKSELFDKRETNISRKERFIIQQEKEAIAKQQHLDELIRQQREQLERMAGISSSEAKEMLIRSMEAEARHDAAKLIKRIETAARENASKKAQHIIALAIKRYAGDYVAEKAVSVVTLPNEEMKGRIIGREGRNIRAIEASTGIDLIIDDTPEAVILSGFNPVRREVARLSLERLISDGRIHPARIEEIVEKVSQEVETITREAGEQAAFDVGVHGIHPELVRLIGKLKYRSSYGQNVLQHSLEVAFLCGIMAAELGENEKRAKRAGLLHDIGKAVDHEVEGPHAIIGAELAKKFGESPQIVHALAAHHEDVEPESVLAVLVQAADTLSGARPGARKELLESYVKRLEDLERIANSFQGVSKSFAIQAGRELRIMVESDKISDEESVLLSRDIAKRIENELSYPGQIKVTVIRETRAVDYAR
ncbi:MAG: ribonuclease Y [Deltaproteobacteria bacterium]|nr:ribonuclease Y [Deltaproteobacteria bacterium]MBW2071724.1 ribonuclease Y [Deltaproteobacteria bacterium]